jgi:hypothetical protein
MPLFNNDDYNDALEADGTPNGMVDISYNLTVERQIIDALSRSIDDPLSSPWMYCPLEELPSVLGVNSPVDDDDDLHSALVLGGVSVAMTLINSIHEDFVPGLLAHLASLHDQIDDAQVGEESIIKPRYLLSQLVEFCEPADPIASMLAMMRIIDTVFDDDGAVLPEKALATAKYLMCIALAVLSGDDEDCTVDLIELLETSHAERATEPVQPYFAEVDDQEQE